MLILTGRLSGPHAGPRCGDWLICRQEALEGDGYIVFALHRIGVLGLFVNCFDCVYTFICRCAFRRRWDLSQAGIRGTGRRNCQGGE